MNEKPDIMITIFGGTNLIAPVATTAIQNFYGGRGDGFADQPEVTEEMEEGEGMVGAEKTEDAEEKMEDAEEMTDEEFHLSVYLSDMKSLKSYVTLVGECTSARELAAVVGKMLSDEQCKNIDKEKVVKGAFIKLLLPFAVRLTSGNTVGNIRLQINNILADRTKKGNR